jgi:hypothetical protein
MSDDRPDNLNDYGAWLARGNLKEAMDALANRVTGIVGNEQTAQMLVRQLRQEQMQRDEMLADRLEQFAHGLKTSLNKSIGAFEEQTIARLDAYAIQIDAIPALVEAALSSGPFGELAQRVGDMETGYADLYKRLDEATDPEMPGATVAMVVLKRRIGTLERLVRLLIIAIAILALLSIAQGAGLVGHHYYIWERLR